MHFGKRPDWSVAPFFGRRMRLRTLIVATSLAMSASAASAAHPPFPVTFFWSGANGSGNGKSDDWQNWVRIHVDPDDLYYEPIDGDQLDFGVSVLTDGTIHRSISLGSHVHVSNIGFDINADLSNGDLKATTIGIINIPYGGFYPTTTFSGTRFRADQRMLVGSYSEPITLSNATITTPLLQLYGADQAVANPAAGAGVTNIVSGSKVDAAELSVGDDFLDLSGPSVHPYVVNVDASTLTGLGLSIRGSRAGVVSHVQLTNGSAAEYEQYVLVGADRLDTLSELVVKGGSTLRAPQAYVNVGEQGPGAMVVADGSFAFMREFNVGVFAKGSVNITNAATVTSDAGALGVISGNEGTVNIETRGTWNTKALTIGQDGTGFVFVRDQSTLKVDGDAILGHHLNSHGFLNLIGPDAKLQLGASGTLTIGDEGAGELHLDQGAQFTSAGDVSLGKIAKSSGTVIATGANSQWTVEGNLTIGEHGTGRVEINDKATVKAGGAGIFIGKQSDADGTLVIDGQGSKLDFDGQLIVADFGKGTLRLKNGAVLTTGSLSLGNFAGSEGTLDLQDAGGNTSEVTLQGDLTVGKAGRGTLKVAGGYDLTIGGDVVMGESSTSGTEATPDSATLSHSRWLVRGNVSIGKAANSHADMRISDGGQLTVEGTFFDVGEEANSSGVLTVTGNDTPGGFQTTASMNHLRIGVRGKGEVTVENGGAVGAGSVVLGAGAGGNGTLTVSDAAMTVDGDMDVGGAGTGKVMVSTKGELTVQGLTIDSDLSVAETASVNVRDINASVSNISANNVNVGMNGRGAFTIESEGIASVFGFPSVRAKTIHVAQGANSVGSLTLSGAKLESDDLEAGVGGTARIDVLSQGRLDVSRALTLGAVSGKGSSTLTVNDATVSAAQILGLNDSSIAVTGSVGRGIVLSAGGTFDLGGSAASPSKLTVESNGLVSVDSHAAGKFRAGSKGRAEVNVRSGGAIKVSDIEVGSPIGNVTSGSSITVTGSDSELNAAELTVYRGASLTTLQGGRAFAGDLAIINGTVDVRGGSLLIGPPTTDLGRAGAVTVNADGVLAGSGSIKGDLIAKNPKTFPHVSGARISPGNSPGLLTVEGNLVIEPGAILNMQIGGLTAADQYDVVNVLGSAHVDGSLALDFIDGFAPKAGDTFSLITGPDLVIAPQIIFLNLADGWQYDILQTNDAWAIRSLNDGVSVPEPAAAALVLVSAFATVGFRRRIGPR